MMNKNNRHLIKTLQYSCLILWISTISLSQAYDTTQAPKFSVKRGFYATNFDVTIDAETTNAKIFYTFDGSDPRTSPTALQKNSPATILVDPMSTEGQRAKAPGFVIRACSQVTGLPKSRSVSHTYFFVDKAAALSPNGTVPGPNWPAPGNYPQFIDYGLNATVLNDSRYKDLIDNSLLAIPSISLSTDLKNLFALDNGIYMNALSDGAAWERPASVELVNPDGSDGFQINAGLRIRGGYSRHPENPKHAFRLFFRSVYGEGNLNFPLFGDEGVSKFDKVDLRTAQNYSWSYPGHMGEYNTMISEVFCRDLQKEMRQPYTRSRFYHLYINGVYWGLFQTQERSEANFAVSYFGGVPENYDVVKNDEGSVSATDGTIDAYNEVYKMCVSGFSNAGNYFKLQGLNTDGTKNPAYKNFVDIDNLIDFMIIIFYGGNFDSPVSKFVGDAMPNNFYCIYDRTKNEGFKFLIHDAEHTLRTTGGEGPGIGLQENRVNVTMSVSSVSQFQPQYLHNRLTSNAEYKIRFADHVYKYFFNKACMTPAKATQMFLSRAAEIDMAIIGESARWGDTYSNPPRNKDDNWKWAVNDIVKNYFPYRTGIVLNQLKAAGLFPNILPPVFINNTDTLTGNYLKIVSGYKVQLTNPNGTTGTIQYTTNGKDPRVIGGAVESSAIDGGTSIELTANTTTVIKARIKNGTVWSALHEITLFTDDNTKDLKVTEIHYHPLDNDTISGNEYEFLEMKNIGSEPINLSAAAFASGITYTFPSGTIVNPNQYIVLCSNQREFNKRYGFFALAEYSGQLDNSGELLTLLNGVNDTIFSIRYDDKLPWPETPDSLGFSLVTKEINPTGDLNLASQWRASNAINGSPGSDDVISSVSTISELPQSFSLFQNYPNPFNPSTTISLEIPEQSMVQIVIYDVLGKQISILTNSELITGRYSFTWNAAAAAGGVYFLRMNARSITSNKNYSSVKKLVLLK